jgi:hypothetical protein
MELSLDLMPMTPRVKKDDHKCFPIQGLILLASIIGSGFFAMQGEGEDFKSNGYFLGCLVFSIALAYGYMVQLHLYRSELKTYRDRESQREPKDSENWIKKIWGKLKNMVKQMMGKGTKEDKSDAGKDYRNVDQTGPHSWFQAPWNKIQKLIGKPKKESAEHEYPKDAGTLPLNDGKDDADLDKWYYDEKLNKYWKVVERQATKSKFTDLLAENGDVESVNSKEIAGQDFTGRDVASNEIAGTDLTDTGCSEEIYITAMVSIVGTTFMILGYLLMSHFYPEKTIQMQTLIMEQFEQLKTEAARLLNI